MGVCQGLITIDVWLMWRLVLGNLGYLWAWCELGRSLVAVWHRAGRVGVLAELGWSVLTV